MPPQHGLPQGGPGAQAMQQSYPGDTGTVIYKGGPLPPPNGQQMQQQQQQAGPRGPLPAGPVDESFPPPPPMRGAGANGGGASADNSLNDSSSTTQSNLASECSEAECDREPLVKQNAANRGKENDVKFGS